MNHLKLAVQLDQSRKQLAITSKEVKAATKAQKTSWTAYRKARRKLKLARKTVKKFKRKAVRTKETVRGAARELGNLQAAVERLECKASSLKPGKPATGRRPIPVAQALRDAGSRGCLTLGYLEPVPKATVFEGRLYYMCNNLRRQVSLG